MTKNILSMTNAEFKVICDGEPVEPVSGPSLEFRKEPEKSAVSMTLDDAASSGKTIPVHVGDEVRRAKVRRHEVGGEFSHFTVEVLPNGDEIASQSK